MASISKFGFCLLFVTVLAISSSASSATHSRMLRSPGTGTNSLQAADRVQNGAPSLVESSATCPAPNEVNACLNNCRQDRDCLPHGRCCQDRCGTTTCVRIPQRPRVRTCEQMTCRQQGSVCVEKRRRAVCKCITGCPAPQSKNDYLCASNNMTYLTRCFMDMAACRSGTDLRAAPCSTFSPPRHSQDTMHPPRAPEAVFIPLPHLAREGDNVTFKCKVRGSPQPSIFWQIKDSHDFISPGTTVGKMSISSRNSAFHIRRVQLRDAGTYTCLAMNNLGSVKLTFNLIVRSVRSAVPTNTNGISYQAKCLTKPRFQSKRCFEPRKNRPIRKYWVFNRVSEACERKYFRDCSAILNKHVSRSECESACQNPCYLPAKRGPCRNFQTRVSYNLSRGVCEPFVFGGCEGNSNNFPNMEKCQQTCPVPKSHSQSPSNCPTCRKHLANAFCSEEFVVSGYVKRVSPANAGSGMRMITLHLTKVFSDRANHGLLMLNLSDPYQAERPFQIATNKRCPCPDFRRLVHSSVITAGQMTSSCRLPDHLTSSRRASSNSRVCTELIISGRREKSFPVIGQGSLAVQATEKNLAYMAANTAVPNLCETIEEMRRQMELGTL